ncbi:Protein LHY [Apostasia shenzhenica]|uniref:Protein LHY n=1 Tax=Apostasia shenzhenica TaxID=1088818 RepID=A0A2I0BEH2_9ASPA|nr:Protein LHY [Apostasia shenzhenica]
MQIFTIGEGKEKRKGGEGRGCHVRGDGKSEPQKKRAVSRSSQREKIGADVAGHPRFLFTTTLFPTSPLPHLFPFPFFAENLLPPPLPPLLLNSLFFRFPRDLLPERRDSPTTLPSEKGGECCFCWDRFVSFETGLRHSIGFFYRNLSVISGMGLLCFLLNDSSVGILFAIEAMNDGDVSFWGLLIFLASKILCVFSTKEMCVDMGETSSVDCIQQMNEGDSSVSEHTIKARKPYTITKQRDRWTEDEHNKFLEALKLYGRAWRRIEEHIGTKTAVQIRSHAQKFFSKVSRESLSSSTCILKAIEIPPPRPKKKPNRPYPRKLVQPRNKNGHVACPSGATEALSNEQDILMTESDFGIQENFTSKEADSKEVTGTMLTSIKLFGRTVIVSSSTQPDISNENTNQQNGQRDAVFSSSYSEPPNTPYYLPSHGGFVSSAEAAIVSFPCLWALYGDNPFPFSNRDRAELEPRKETSSQACFRSNVGNSALPDPPCNKVLSASVLKPSKNSAFSCLKPLSSSLKTGFAPYKTSLGL